MIAIEFVLVSVSCSFVAFCEVWRGTVLDVWIPDVDVRVCCLFRGPDA